MNTPQPIEASAGHTGLSVTALSTPALGRATERAGAFARRGADALRDTSLHLRDAALRTSDNAVQRVRNEPVKSVLIAAVAGALLMALVGLLTRPRAD